MKRIVYLFVMFMSLCACNNSGNGKQDLDTDTGISVNVPTGWELGEGSDYSPLNKAEENLIAQHKTYDQALIKGNVSEVKRFFYRESITYFKKYYPLYSDEEILDEFLSEVSADHNEKLSKLEEAGIYVSLYVGDILRKVVYNEDYLYVFGVHGRMEGYKNDSLVYLHTISPSLTLGVSHNKGKNWTFMAMTDETPSVLIMNYPQNIVDDVMGY